MNVIASLQSGFRNLLGIPAGLAASASLPTEETFLNGRPVNLVSVPKPTAALDSEGGPGKLIRGNPPEMDELVKAIALVRNHMVSGKPAARPLAKLVPVAKPAPKSNYTPQAKAIEPLDDKGVPQATPPEDEDDSLDTAYRQLQDVLEILKTRIKPTTEDDADEDEAKALFNRGLKSVAYKKIMALTRRFCVRTAEEARKMNLSPQARLSEHMTEQPTVAALQAALRPRVAPVATATPATDPVARIREIDAEIATLDKEQRKRFSNEANAKHLALSREKSVCLKRLHAS